MEDAGVVLALEGLGGHQGLDAHFVEGVFQLGRPIRRVDIDLRHRHR